MSDEQALFIIRHIDLISPWMFSPGELQRRAYIRLAARWRLS